MSSQSSAAAERPSPIKFGTSGWRGLIADDFTFANVRLAVTAIAEHAKTKAKQPTILVGYDTRFYSGAQRHSHAAL
jgi:phosphomannomutase